MSYEDDSAAIAVTKVTIEKDTSVKPTPAW